MSTTQIPTAHTPVLDVEDGRWRASDNHGYAVDLHRDLSGQAHDTLPRVPSPSSKDGEVRAAHQPRSTGFELADL